MTNTNTNNTDTIAADIEAGMKILAADLAGRKDYASVAYESNVNGATKWTCYTPDAGHTDGKTYAEALAGQRNSAGTAAKLRADAAALLAKAAALDAKGGAQ